MNKIKVWLYKLIYRNTPVMRKYAFLRKKALQSTIAAMSDDGLREEINRLELSLFNYPKPLHSFIESCITVIKTERQERTEASQSQRCVEEQKRLKAIDWDKVCFSKDSFVCEGSWRAHVSCGVAYQEIYVYFLYEGYKYFLGFDRLSYLKKDGGLILSNRIVTAHVVVDKLLLKHYFLSCHLTEKEDECCERMVENIIAHNVLNGKIAKEVCLDGYFMS